MAAISIDFAESNPALIARVGWSNVQGEWSNDGRVNWSAFVTTPGGGPRSIAISSDGTRWVWAPNSGTPVYSLDNGATWTASTGAPANAAVISDRVNPLKFYAYDSGSATVYVSLDGAQTFTAAASGLTNGIALHALPGVEGDLWLAAGNAIYHSSNSGASFTNIGTVEQADSLGFGAAAPAKTYPTLYISGHVNNVIGIFRSTDAGATWVRINDNTHQWGRNGTITGDPRIFGRV